VIESLYIAGPMTGLPEFNYPAFNEAAAELRARNYAVENPAENPPPVDGSWAGYMRMSVQQILSVDAIATLPGWDTSRGASLEVYLATQLGIPVRPVAEWLRAAPAWVGDAA
jgi:hypothetical protein